MISGSDIRRARVKKGRSQAELARRMSVTRNAVSLWESGSATPRWQTMQRLIAMLDLPSEWRIVATEDRSYQNIGMPVIGEVAPGVWHDPEMRAAVEPDSIPVAPDQRYPSNAQFAVRVRGAGGVAPEGAYLVCVDFERAGVAPRDGDLVYIERSRGGLVEYTVRRYRVGPSGPELRPEPDNSGQGAIPASGDGEVRIAIRGLVIYIVQPVPRGA